MKLSSQISAPGTDYIAVRDHYCEAVLGRFRGRKVLVLGIGGGGDVISTLPTCCDLGRLGAEVIPGGLSWKRSVHDSAARARRIDEFQNIDRVNELVGLCSTLTHIPVSGPVGDRIQHVEAQLSTLLDGQPVLTLDIQPGSRAIAEALLDFMKQCGVTDLIGIDAGGDALCIGDESTIRSPICDQMLMAALSLIPDSLIGVHSFGTDGEFPFAQLEARFNQLVSFGGYRGALDINPDDHARLEGIISGAKTESSRFSIGVSKALELHERTILLQQVNGERPTVSGYVQPWESFPLRDGSRVGELGPLTACTLFFGAKEVFESNSFSSWWRHDASVPEIHVECTERGIITELSDRLLPLPELSNGR